MLYLGHERIIENTTVFRDHEDHDVYWYLPNHISIAVRDGLPVFTFTPYINPASNQGGAFLNFEVNLQLPTQLESAIKNKIRTNFGDWGKQAKNIQLNPAPWDEGTAECIIIDLQGGGGKVNRSAENDKVVKAVKFADKILGSVRPSFDNKNNAVFSVHLHKEGAIFLQALWAENKKDYRLGVIYNLKYTGLAPSFNAHISADMEQLYNHLSLDVEAQYKLVKAGIETGVESAIRNQIIKYETTDFSKDKSNKELEDWLKQFFTDKVISEWMQPVLTPVRVVEKDTGTGEPSKKITNLRDNDDDQKITGIKPDGAGDAEKLSDEQLDALLKDIKVDEKN